MTKTHAEGWPAWTDEVVFGLGPDPDDQQWWADQNEDWHEDDVPPDVYDDLAEEAEARDLMDRGLLM